MKARYKGYVNRQQKDYVKAQMDDMQERFAILYEKILIYVLHNEFGFGVKRIKQLVDEMNGCVDQMHSDPTFWDKCDKDVIGNLGFDYPKCDYEFMEKVFYDVPEISAADKRADVADFAKMREFLKARENNDTG